jgi:hypothetical protein
MSYIQREIEKIAQALGKGPESAGYDRLYLVQQALSWALDPEVYASPTSMISGILEGLEDCLAGPRPLPS